MTTEYLERKMNSLVPEEACMGRFFYGTGEKSKGLENYSTVDKILGTVRYGLHCLAHFPTHAAKTLAGIDSDDALFYQAMRIGRWDFIEKAKKNRLERAQRIERAVDMFHIFDDEE